MMLRLLAFLLSLAVAGGASPAVAAPAPRTFHRVVYADDPALKLAPDLVREAFGGDVHVIPAEGSPPARPAALPGVVMFSDYGYDADWVVGARNPQLEYARIKGGIGKILRGIGDIDDKWHEFRFLETVAPEMAPPRMRLAGSFRPEPKDAAEAAQVEALARSELARHRGPHEPPLPRLVALELLRRRMHDALGKAFVKVRLLNHSEGRLPKTTDDWIGTYLSYFSKTKPRIEKIEREIEGTSVWLQERIFNLPYIEGRTLEALLDQRQDLVVQEKVGIDKEIRIHVVEGRVLAGATFLRFYPVGQYLTPAQVARVERSLRRGFIARLPPELARLSFTSDMILESGTGRVRFLDFNCGLDSGYYWPSEDLITSNLLAAELTGRRTPLLERLDALFAESPGPKKAALMRAWLARFAPFMEGDVAESFWDRMLRHYRDWIAEAPTSSRFRQALEDLKAAGLRGTSNYLQLICEVQDTWPELALPAAELSTWAERLARWDPELLIGVEGHRLSFREIVPMKTVKKRAGTAKHRTGRRSKKSGKQLVPQAETN